MSASLSFAPGFRYWPDWLGGSRASDLLECLESDMPWCQNEIFVFGKSRLEPRLTAWCSDPDIRYAYSGRTLDPAPWHPELDSLRVSLNEQLNRGFNSVLLNAYRDGNDAMGWHADDEPELGTRPVVASISLGATRRFLVRPKKGGSRRSIPLDLRHGDLLVMDGRSQSDWQHSLPRTKKNTGLRINLTFRQVMS